MEASNEKVKRLSQQHEEELRLDSEKQLKEQETQNSGGSEEIPEVKEKEMEMGLKDADPGQ